MKSIEFIKLFLSVSLFFVPSTFSMDEYKNEEYKKFEKELLIDIKKMMEIEQKNSL